MFDGQLPADDHFLCGFGRSTNVCSDSLSGRAPVDEEVTPATSAETAVRGAPGGRLDGLTWQQRESLRTVFDADLPEDHRRLIDLRYPWTRRPYHDVSPAAVVAALIGALLAIAGYAHPGEILVGAFLFVCGAVVTAGPNILLARNERRSKKIYDASLPLSVPALDLGDIAEAEPDLGVLIWRMQQVVDGVNRSEARHLGLLNGVVTMKALTDVQLDLADQIGELVAERALLSQADGRAALRDVLRPRRDAAATWLATITESVAQLEAIHAEVTLLDERLADIRIAEQILGASSPLTRPIPMGPADVDSLHGAAAGIRAVREFIAMGQPNPSVEDHSV